MTKNNLVSETPIPARDVKLASPAPQNGRVIIRVNDTRAIMWDGRNACDSNRILDAIKDDIEGWIALELQNRNGSDYFGWGYGAGTVTCAPARTSAGKAKGSVTLKTYVDLYVPAKSSGQA